MTRLIHCAECGRNKPHCAKGLCRRCYNRQWNAAHPDKVREYDGRWAKANPDKARERFRRWYIKNRERDNECSRQYRIAYPDKVRECDRQWAKANPDKTREKSRCRRARKLDVTIGLVDEAAIFERDGMCMYCGTTHEKLTIDHVVPLSGGGPHCQDNLVAACGRCNSSKQDKPLEDWLRTQPKAMAWVF